MEENQVFDGINIKIIVGSIETLKELKTKLQEYSTTCPQEEKSKCDNYLSQIEERIEMETVRDEFTGQHAKLKDFVNSYNHQLIKLEYIEPYGNSFGVDVFIDVEGFVMEITFKPSEDINRNEIQSTFSLNVNGSSRQFVLKKEFSQNSFENLKRFRRDYYIQSATLSNWADAIIDAIKAIENEPEKFLQICEQSCPFNKDGTHKYKSWKTFAKVEVSFVENTELVQGIKKDEFVAGSHAVGGNGSFRYWDKRTYVLKYTVDRLACEKPLKFTKEVDADEYFRALKERVGRKNLPYELLNSKLNEKIGVITTDMNKDPEDRDFYPVDYNHDWLKFLDESFKDL